MTPELCRQSRAEPRPVATMQSDDVIWQIIKNGFCSFKAKSLTQMFCRHEHNVTGLCNRVSCPLANSKYATIMEKDGQCYLYMKTIERAHLPSKLWEVIPLGDNFKKALETIDQNLEYWPDHMINRVKQRLTKIWQYLIRMRKLRQSLRPQVIAINKKVERREAVREREALGAAQVEKQIKKELLERLAHKAYGEIYNFAPSAFEEVLDEQTQPDEFYEEEYVEGEYDDMPGDLENLSGEDGDDDDVWDEDNLMSGLNDSDYEEEPIFGGQDNDDSKDQAGSEDDDGEELYQPPKAKRPKLSSRPSNGKKKTRRPHLEIEMETEPAQSSRSRH